MKKVKHLKMKAARGAARELMSLLALGSARNLLRIMKIAERIPLAREHRDQVRWLRGLFEAGHPATRLATRILHQAHPNYRRGLVMNLFVNATWLGDMKRREVQERDGFYPPFLVVISPTMRCNLHCSGCYAGNYTTDEDLAFEEVDRIITEAKEMGTYFVTISGGEPLVYPGLLDLFEKHRDVAFQFYTNGTLINEVVADRLVELGNVTPAISVEGFEEQTDARRGRGAWLRIMRAMDLLRERGAIFAFSGTVTRHNVDVIASDAFVDLMIEKGCYYGWYFTYLPIGRAPSLDLMPTPEQRDTLRQRVLEFRRTKPIFIGDFWNDGHLTGGCIAGGRIYFHINHRGDIEPCVFAHFAVDNIRGKSLGEALASPFFKAIQARQPFNENLLLPCMLVDNPHILRELVAETGARPTHEGAETLITDFASALDQYAREYGKLADEAWRTGYGHAKGEPLVSAKAGGRR